MIENYHQRYCIALEHFIREELGLSENMPRSQLPYEADAIEAGQFADAMIFCLEHRYPNGECSDLITELVSYKGKPIHDIKELEWLCSSFNRRMKQNVFIIDDSM